MNVVILGADGFIGRHLCEALARDAAMQVQALAAAERRLPLAGCDVVVNCTTDAPAAIRRAAVALSAVCATATVPPRLVHLGSMTVYGDAEGLLTEDAPLREGLSDYADAQVAAERQLGLLPRRVLLRPGVEYGPGCVAWSERVARWLCAGRLGDLGDDGEGDCNLLYVDDLVAALVAAIRTPGIEGRCYNLAGETPTWNGYFRRFGAAFGLGALPSITPSQLGLETRLYAPPLKIAERLLARLGGVPRWLPPAIPPSLPRLCRQRLRLDASRAAAELGLRWTPLDTGLAATATALRAGRAVPV